MFAARVAKQKKPVATGLSVDEFTGAVFFKIGRPDGSGIKLFDMPKLRLLFFVCAAAVICGCDKQTKINTAKIDALAQKVAQLQQLQAKQLAEIQTQLTALTPTLDKMSGTYFAKSHEDAIFFHTNTLYLLLLVDQKIEAELQTAAVERAAEHALVNAYHTNELEAVSIGVAQLKDALAVQGGQIETNINARTTRMIASFSGELAKQIKEAMPDAAEIARWRQMAADVAQMKSDLARIHAQLGSILSPTNHP